MVDGVPLLAGTAAGPVLALGEPLSFWGGLDPISGRIIDRRHPQCGAQLGGVVLVMPFGRGSSSSSSVLAEAIRLGTGPTAILLRERDEIVVLGALAAEELYGVTCPVAVLDEASYGIVAAADRVRIERSGRVLVEAADGASGSILRP